jgi:hypothetical protein
MSPMTPARHEEVARHAGDLLIRPLPKPFFADEPDFDVSASRGVYITCTRSDDVLYVGSAYRPSDRAGLVRRVREHSRNGSRRLRWLRVWLLPMKSDADKRQVELIEGMVGRDLGCLENERLPRILPAASWEHL